MKFDEFKNGVQYLTLVLSLFFNMMLICLAILKSSSKMGSYKYLIIYFCTFSATASIIEAVVNPFMLSVGSVFVLAMNLSDNIIKDRTLAKVLVQMTCGCFGFIISLITIHFIFRYFAIQREGNLKYFRKQYLLFWLVIPILYGVAWSLSTAIFLEPNDHVTYVLGNFLKTEYDINMDNVVYTGSDYFTDSTRTNFNYKIFPGMMILATIIISSLTIVIYCGIKTSIRIESLELEGLSEYTRQLQKQLFKALVLQSCVPLFLLYLPVSIFLFLPAFNIQIDKIGHIVTLFCAVYPVIDPLPTILIVDNYRESMKELLCGKKKISPIQNQQQCTTIDQ